MKQILAVLCLLLITSSAKADERRCPSTFFPMEVTPIQEMVGFELLDMFTITTCEIWHEGEGTINGYMMTESDAIIMTRVAMGEAPASFDDRFYIMWNIKLRAELGFKNAGDGGWDPPTDKWGPETSIKREALCWGGCQYAPVRATSGIYFPEELGRGQDFIRGMIAPETSNQLMNFWFTYQSALEIVDAPLSDMPAELRGYDSFRSPQVDWIGTRHRIDGHKSVQFFYYGNIWRDQYPQDNEYWEALQWKYFSDGERTAGRQEDENSR